jgi:succinate dehydrogenase / fumarate reductase cytochrome b subunit
MASSILHRATGTANAIGSLLVVGWLLALALGPEAYAAYQSFFGWWPVQIVLFGFTVAIMYHLANGIRHLVWDSGHGFNPKLSDATGLFCMAFGLFGAIAVWVFAGLVPGITLSQFGG